MCDEVCDPGNVSIDHYHPVPALKEQARVPPAPGGDIENPSAGGNEWSEANHPRRRLHDENLAL